MDQMEKDLEFDELRLLRELTYRQLEKRISAGEVRVPASVHPNRSYPVHYAKLQIKFA